MSTLASGLRSELERVVINARDAAETGARAALEALAVHHKAPYPHMGSDLRQLRNQLRAQGPTTRRPEATKGRCRRHGPPD